MQKQDHGLDTGLDMALIAACAPVLQTAPGAEVESVLVHMEVGNTNRRASGLTVGGRVTSTMCCCGLAG